MMQAAWSASPRSGSAGAPGLVQSFFDELFNHLDPYSRYVAPLQAVADREHRSGDAGIGAVLVHARHGDRRAIRARRRTGGRCAASGPASRSSRWTGRAPQGSGSTR